MTIIIVCNNCRFSYIMEILLESLKFGITPAIVVAIYLTINKILVDRKEAQEAKLSNDIVQSFNKLNTFLDHITKDIIARESDKCNSAIKNAFQRLENMILKYVNHTIINNNVEINRKHIIDNVHHLINAEYYNLYNTLMLYSTEKLDLTKYMNVIWKDELFNDVTEIVFNADLTKEQKIYSLQNKIDFRVNDYMINVLNRYTEHEC